MIHYLFNELCHLNIYVSLNYFCEKHGKNSRDQHFSEVSYFIQRESLVRRICSSQDICNAIEKQQQIANNNTKRINSKHKDKTTSHRVIQSTKSFVIPMGVTKFVKKKFRVIQNLTSYYNFFNNCSEFMKTHYMSDNEHFNIVNFKDSCKRVLIYLEKKGIEKMSDKVKPNTIKSVTLKKKIFNWNLVQRKNKISQQLSRISSYSEYSDMNSTQLHTYEFCKEKCQNCKQICSFRISELNNDNEKSVVSALKIKTELKLHGHPASRSNKKTKKQRTLLESMIELKNHYFKFHLSKE
jgi:hypothetical protein